MNKYQIKVLLPYFGREGSNCKKKILKDILNNVKPNSKAQATATFSISALISEKWAFKAKKC